MGVRADVTALQVENDILKAKMAQLEIQNAILKQDQASTQGQVTELRDRLWPLFQQGADKNAEMIVNAAKCG